jgi:glucosamine kinase
MTFFVGVDGGGTRTRAVIIDDAGREVGRAAGAGAVATASAPERAASAVIATVREAAETAGVALPASVLWAGLAGAGAAEARDRVRTALAGGGLAERVVVGTDVEAAFHNAFPDEPGVLLIAGTGSIAWSRDGAGAVTRVGGWGRHLGDEGSGFWIGMEGLRAVVRAADTRSEETLLSKEILAGAGVPTVEGLVPWVETAEKGQVAALAPIVAAQADAGDAVAMRIVRAAIDALVDHVTAACPAERPPVLLWGGLVAGDGPLRKHLQDTLAEEGFPTLERAVDPALGAALLGRKAFEESKF